jgi:ribose transport system permease protein
MKNSLVFRSLLQYAGLLGVLLLLVIVFGAVTKNFLQATTFITIANQIPDLVLVSVGMTLVLIGSVLALTAAIGGVLIADYQWSVWLAIPCCLMIGALCGTFNGSVSVFAKIPSFIVTLGMLEIARGATLIVDRSEPKYIGASIAAWAEPIAGLFVSPAFLIAAGVVIAGQFLLSQTVFGRYCIAIGTNAEAVRMSGIRTEPYTIGVFIICGVLCAMAGLVNAARISFAEPSAGIGMELSAIAACVIGGTSLMGGRGNVFSSFLGVLIIAVLQTGLAQVGATDPMKQVITGSVIVIAVLLDAIRTRWSRTSG